MRQFSLLILICILSVSCQKNSSQTWENVKTAGRYVNKGLNALWGKDNESRLITSEEEFTGPSQEDYIPLKDDDLKTTFTATDQPIPQSNMATAALPEKANFKRPSAKLGHIFRVMHFDTDDHVIREKYDLVSVARIANYLKKHQNAFLLVEGHTDQRASADYNLALGTRRANHIRVLLAKQGVDPQKIITVSCGKEKPIAFGRTPQDYALNRRAEFKIFEK
ncbi:MAG: OmpA family protein [Chlamydiota bacterium]|jgi:peptidoglycan-associated lipoprotein